MRWLAFFSLVLASWCVMTFTHELGHLLGGWCCGGTLKQADLLPWHLPFSIFEPDPYPLVTLWCGPLLGVLMPVVLALLIRLGRESNLHHWVLHCGKAKPGYLAR